MPRIPIGKAPWYGDMDVILDGIEGKADAAAEEIGDRLSETSLSATIAAQAVPQANLGYSSAKKAAFSFGGSGGQGTTTSFADVVQRLPLRLPVTTTRWRLHISNRDYRNGGSAGTSQIDGTGCWVGEHALDANGDWTGGFVEAAPAQAFGAWQVGPTSSHEFVSAWVTAAAQQFTAHKPHLLSLGWTAAALTPKVRGIGACYLAQGVVAQANRQAAFGGSFTSNTSLLDVWVEYETAGANPVGLVLGDSLSEGNSSGRGQCGSWLFQHALLNGELMISGAYSGSTTANFTDPAGNKWTRYDGITPDFAVVALGTNDVSSAVALATIQANLRTIYANLRTKYGRQLPIYVCTIAPRGFVGATDQTRVDLNKWLRNLPAGVTGCFDWDKAVQDQAARNVADGVTNSTTTVTSNTALFTPSDVGRTITGAGIPAGATITAVVSATSVTISAAATATASAVSITIGSGPAVLDPEFNSGDGIHMTVSGYGRLARQVPGRLTRF